MGRMDFASPASSPPTPPSPLPISLGPGCERYCFSTSPSPSPPFSPHSRHESPESTPLLSGGPIQQRTQPSAFSLDKPPEDPVPRSSWLEACLEWMFLRCCCWWSDVYQTNIERKSNSHSTHIRIPAEMVGWSTNVLGPMPDGTKYEMGANEFRSIKSKSFDDFNQLKKLIAR